MNLHRFVTSTALAAATLFPFEAALAACMSPIPSGAVWHVHALEAHPTDFGTYATEVDIIRCVATFGAAGAFSGPCKTYAAGSSTVNSINVTGTIALTADCDFTGSIKIPGDGTVSIKFGHINGVMGSGIGIHGTGAATRVVQLTLIKK